ncbi:MAG: hypothetical protein QXT06_05860 [Candidatus Bathyarchaeia archaeon]
MSYEVLPQEQEHLRKLMEVRKQLLLGPKTWSELIANLQMSKPTLSKCLIELQKRGEIQKIGIIEGDKSKVVYQLVDPLVKKVYEMFEETQNRLIPSKIKEELDIEQEMIRWFYNDIWMFMHFARKITQLKSELPEKKAQQYIREWIALAAHITSVGIKNSLKWIAEKGEKSWIDIFGKYEDEPEQIIEALWKYAEKLRESREKEEMEIKS